MPSPSFTNCINCGHQVSTKATECPACESPIRECCVCGRPINKSDLTRNWDFHLACMAEHFVMPESLCCPDCKHPFEISSIAKSIAAQEKIDTYYGSYGSLPKLWSSCPNCGSPDPLCRYRDMCSTCKMPILQSFQIRVEDSYYIFADHLVSSSRHSFCKVRENYEHSYSINSPLPNWGDGFLHWMVNGSWYSNAPQKAKNNGCFIATAAYGTPMQPDVQTLSEFRDTILVASSLGRVLSTWYARLSPAIARHIHAESFSGALVRAALSPVVAAIKYCQRERLQ